MNKGMYGFGLPPNVATRVAPPTWARSKVITTAGAFSFTVPQNVYQLAFVAAGAGGGGGGWGGTINIQGGTGGGGGGYAEGILDVIPGQTITGVIGAGGAAGVGNNTAASATAGSAGGTTSIGTAVSCTGGNGGNKGTANNGTVAGGTGGTATAVSLIHI